MAQQGGILLGSDLEWAGPYLVAVFGGWPWGWEWGDRRFQPGLLGVSEASPEPTDRPREARPSLSWRPFLPPG